MFLKIQIIACSIIFLFYLQSASQDYDTLFIKPGPEEGKDVILRSVYPNINEGDHHDMMAAAWTLSGDFFINRILTAAGSKS